MPSKAAMPSVTLRSMKRSLTRRLWYDEKLPPDVIQALRDGEIDRLLFASAPLQVKDRCAVARYDHPAGPLLVKRLAWGGLSRTVRAIGREASARRCTRLGLHLHHLGIPTPLPRACMEHFFGPWGYLSYLMTDYDEGTSLYRYLRFGTQSDGELQSVTGQVARIWQQLAELGISHNDLKPENFIVDVNRDVWLIDLEKTRLRGKPDGQRRRNVFDAGNLLHIRGWHRRQAAREMMLSQLRATSCGHWLDELRLDGEIDAELSVLVFCENVFDVASTRQAIESVKDIADEVVLLGMGDDGNFGMIERIHFSRAAPTSQNMSTIAAYPWVLVLHQNEVVTPLLAKDLQQKIVSPAAHDAYHIALEPRYFGQSIAPGARGESEPIRLFQQDRCTHSIASGIAEVSANPAKTGRFTIGTIQQCMCGSVDEYVERLNERTTNEAWRRLARDERASLIRGISRAAARFTSMYARRSGIGSGWAGFQIAALEAAFAWIEEAKLRQLSRNFFLARMPSEGAQNTVSRRSQTRLSHTELDASPARKAA
jgi:hypothetical protein